MADDYGFEEASESREHPLDTAEHVSSLRHNQTLRALFKNLENRPKDRVEKFPAWVFEALADQMTFSIMKLSYENRNPESLEDFYKRQGMISAYEGLANYYSQQALNIKAEMQKGGS